MPQTRAQQRARRLQGQTVTPPQRLPIAPATRRPRRAPAQAASTNAVAAQSTNPLPSAPVVPQVPNAPEVPQVIKVPSKACVITAFSKEHKVGKEAFTFDAPSENSAYLKLAQQAESSAADAAVETSAIFPTGSGSPAASSIDASPIQRPIVVSTENANPSPLSNIVAPPQDTTPVTQDNGEGVGVSALANTQAPIRLASPPAGHQTLTSRVAYNPARGESKDVKISVLNGRTMTMSIPEKELGNLFDYLVKMYGAVEQVPELTISTGKRRATEELEDTRPARKVRLDGAQSGEVFSVAKLPTQMNLCYQPKQGDATHSQKYRMIVQGHKEEGQDYPVVIPTYDAQGQNTGSKIFVPVQGDEDDTDLDSDVDAASTSFKEDLPTEEETAETGPTDELQVAQGLPEASNIDTQGHEGTVQPAEDSTQLAQEPVELAQEATGNLLIMPETPNNRGLFGNIVNSAARFIPRFGRATQGRAAPANAPDTPSHSSTQVQRPVPQTEPRPTTQPQTPSQGQSSTLTRAASVQKPQTKGKARVSEDIAQLNVRKKAEKFARRMEPLEIEAKRRAIEQRIRELEKMDEDLKVQEENYEARLKSGEAPPIPEDRPFVPIRPFRDGSKRRAALFTKTNTVPETEEEQAANALWPPGRRIAEAREALQRRKNPSGRIRGPSNKGLGINNNVVPNSNEGEDVAINSNTNEAPAPFTPHDPSYPVGDPYSARPARGSFFHEGPSPSKLQGGNLFRNVDADQESALSYLFRTPRGEPIVQFNKSGHFQLPDESSSDEDEPSSSAIKTPAPHTPSVEPVSKLFSVSALQVPVTPTPAAAASAMQAGSSVPATAPVLKGILKNTSYTPKVYPKGQWEPRQETIARNKRMAAEALARDIAEDARKRELAEESLKKAEEALKLKEEALKKREDAIASKTAIAKAAALKYAPKEPSKLNFVEQAASSPLAAPSEKSFIEAASSAETGDVSTTAINGAEAPPAAEDENDALTDDGSEDGSTSSEDSQEMILFRGVLPMSRRAAKWVESQSKTLDVEQCAKDFLEGFAEFKKTYKPDGPETKFSPKVKAWLNSAEVRKCVEEDTPIIAAEIRRSFERGYAL